MGRILVFAVALSACATVRSPDSYSVYPPYTLQVTAPEAKVRHVDLGEVSPIETIGLIIGLQAAVENHEKAITVDIDSPGGSVAVGLNILDRLHEAQKGGMKVTCRVGPNAMAASMAAIILESGCDVREMDPTASLLFHEPAMGTQGKQGDFERAAGDLEDTCRRTAILVAPHLKHKDGSRWSATEYMAWIKGRDRWVDAVEALEIGAIDEVL